MSASPHYSRLLQITLLVCSVWSSSAKAFPSDPLTGRWESSEFQGIKYAVYGGQDLAMGQRKYPLVLTLHGRSDETRNGQQVTDWMRTFAKEDNYRVRPCIIVAPMAVQPGAQEGRGWDEPDMPRVIKLLKHLIQELPVDPKRVYIVGHSMGAFGACHIMGSYPQLFAAGIAVAGVSGPADAADLRGKPFWLFHAADDTAAPIDESRRFAGRLKGSTAFRFTEFASGGHGVVARVFEDRHTHEWLFEQHLR